MRQRDAIRLAKGEGREVRVKRPERVRPPDPVSFKSDEERAEELARFERDMRGRYERGVPYRGTQVARLRRVRMDELSVDDVVKLNPDSPWDEYEAEEFYKEFADRTGKVTTLYSNEAEVAVLFDNGRSHIFDVEDLVKLGSAAKVADISKWTDEEIPEDATCSDCGHYIHVPNMKSGGKCRIKGMQMGRSGKPAARSLNAPPCEAFVPRVKREGGVVKTASGIRLDEGDFGWDYVLTGIDEVGDETGEDILIQTDWDYPGTAMTFGWSPAFVQAGDEDCEHEGTDGTIDCPECGVTASEFIASAAEWLDDHVGDEVEDPGYFEGAVASRITAAEDGPGDYRGDAKNEQIFTEEAPPKKKRRTYQPGEKDYNKARERGESPPHYFWRDDYKMSRRAAIGDFLEDEDELERVECPECGGEGAFMGNLWKREWFRCVDCGIDFSRAREASKTAGIPNEYANLNVECMDCGWAGPSSELKQVNGVFVCPKCLSGADASSLVDADGNQFGSQLIFLKKDASRQRIADYTSQDGMMDDIKEKAKELGNLQRQIKERSMQYQPTQKEELAKKHGLPFDAYYDLPYEEWAKIRDAGQHTADYTSQDGMMDGGWGSTVPQGTWAWDKDSREFKTCEGCGEEFNVEPFAYSGWDRICRVCSTTTAAKAGDVAEVSGKFSDWVQDHAPTSKTAWRALAAALEVENPGWKCFAAQATEDGEEVVAYLKPKEDVVRRPRQRSRRA